LFFIVPDPFSVLIHIADSGPISLFISVFTYILVFNTGFPLHDFDMH